VQGGKKEPRITRIFTNEERREMTPDGLVD
jgi:hypothetical protein